MHVAVDEPGQERVPREVDARCPAAPAPRPPPRRSRPSSTTTARPRTGSAPVPSISRAPLSTSVSERPWPRSDLEARVERVAEPVAEAG